MGGANNQISGAPLFTDQITLQTNATQLALQLSVDLTGSISLNGGQIELLDSLSLAEDARLTGSGTVLCNGRSLEFSPSDRSWTGTWELTSASRVVLNSNIDLSGTLKWGGDEPAVLLGNAHTLDLSSGGTLWVRAGKSLLLQDMTLKGIGSGYILLEDELSTLSLHNVTLQLSQSYTVTQGSFYVRSDNSHVVCGSYDLTFDQNGTLSVDGVYLTYDPLSEGDGQNIKPTSAGNKNRANLNGGNVTLSSDSKQPNNLIFDNQSNYLTGDYYVHSTDQLNFRGQGASQLTLDGNGLTLNFSQETSTLILVADGKQATVTNLTMKNFRPEHLQLGAGSSLIFGDKTHLVLQDNLSLAYTITCEGSVTIESSNNSLTFVPPFGGIRLSSFGSLYLQDLSVAGVQSNFILFDGSSKITLHNSDFLFDQNHTFSVGTFDVIGDCHFTSSWATIAYTSTCQLTITEQSTLFLDRGLTFSYDSAAASRSGIAFADAASRLFLRGATLHTTPTGIDFVQGRMVVDETVTFTSEATNDVEAVSVGSNFDLYVTAGGALHVYGRFVCE